MSHPGRRSGRTPRPDRGLSRRTLLTTGLGGAAASLGPAAAAAAPPAGGGGPAVAGAPASPPVSLAPASWIWYPSRRTLPATFVLFRRAFHLARPPRRALVRISADSRYLLTVNGARAGFGPAPCDPRALEVDGHDVTAALSSGENVLGALVLFYGHGDGTWATGKPGLAALLEVEHADGRTETIATDEGWACHLSRAWPAGRAKRWYLRALQEVHDARLHPVGWDRPGFRPDRSWRPAMRLAVPPDRPPLAGGYPDYLNDASARAADCRLEARALPALVEELVPARFVESHAVVWDVPVEEYFDVLPPGGCRAEPGPRVQAQGTALALDLDGRRGVALTFDLPEQAVGFPAFTIEAPAGTTVEVMVQEGHVPGGPPVMNTHRHSWGRFVCREGVNRFETFEYESCRWIQLHLHGARGRVTVRDMALRRRRLPFVRPAEVRLADPALQRLVEANLNTLVNCAQETIVDGMGRERQQYSGDVGHVVHALHMVHAEARLCGRFVRTYAAGLTHDGFFLDCWPGTDRLVRLGQRQLGLTPWGPLVDHGVGFVFDCWYHLLHGGRDEEVREVYPRLQRFVAYLASLRGPDGLLPVEGLGVPVVWIDHEAYAAPRHKTCAFNLYAAAMLDGALAPLARALGDEAYARQAERMGRDLLAATRRRFWSASRGLFVANLPWQAEEGRIRLDDRALATSILFDQCPGGRVGPAVAALVSPPPELGLSYPPNVVWNVWALGKAGRGDAVLADLRRRWVDLQSVRENNTLSENWQVRPDTGSQWSHAPMAPLLATYMVLAGIRPLAPGYRRYEVRPQLADLTGLALTAHTPQGPIRFAAEGGSGARTLTLALPAAGEGELAVDPRETLALPRARGPGRFRLPAGETVTVALRHG